MVSIAFIGIGSVGSALANRLQLLGHMVTIGARNPASESVQKALALNPRLLVADPKAAAEAAEIVFLATPFPNAVDAFKDLNLKGKCVVDCTNPVGPGLTHGLGNTASGSETIQKAIPDAHVVKAFTIYGYENFQNSKFPEGKATMLYCGNNQAAKDQLAPLIAELEFEPVDCGGLDTALHLEHITLLWIKMCRVQGHPNFTFKTLRI